MNVIAVQHLRRMRGGAQGHLMRCSDENLYVVKFHNNPQHVRVLANELLATRLAKHLGLPVGQPAVVEVDEWLIAHTPELYIQLAHNTVRCEPGLQFGSKYAVNPAEGQVFDYLPIVEIGRVRNLEMFAGILPFDKWTGNADSRQAAFWRINRDRKYSVAFIDQGNCFNSAEWGFPDDPLHGVYSRTEVYEGVQGWESFEPWLSGIEKLEEDVIWSLAIEVPPAWYEGKWDDFERMVRILIARREMVRALIESFRCSSRRPFPRWRGGPPLRASGTQRKIG